MALPVFNDIPKYDLTIPSTNEKVRFRPFLVKEQKILLMAMESKDQSKILDSITDTLTACFVDVKVDQLTTFDVEYMFTQLRGKSVGETSDITILCTECDAENKITLNIEDINIKVEHEVPEIVLTDKYTLKMRYPKYVDIVKTMINPDLKEVDKLFHTALVSLDSLLTENERILFDDETEEERLQFLDGLNSAQFEKIMEFVNAIPRLKKEIKFKCRSCEHDNNQLVEGIESFF